MAFCALSPGFTVSLKELLKQKSSPLQTFSSHTALAQHSGFTGKESDSKANTQLNVIKYLKSKIRTGFMFGNKFFHEGYSSLEQQH